MRFIENQTNTIDQFLEDLIETTICTAEIVAHQYGQKVKDEKRKILKNQDKFKKTPTVVSVITAIENRQLNMIQSAQYNLDQVLKSLFSTSDDDASGKQA
jgi:hypothetical protein